MLSAHSHREHSIKLIADLLCLLTLTIAVVTSTSAQTANRTKVSPSELHAGIEIGNQVIRAVALRISNGDEGYNIKVLYSDSITPSVPYPKSPQLTSEYIRDIGVKVQNVSQKLQREFQIPADQIYVIGLSELAEQNRDDLLKEVQNKTGRTINFLTPENEIELNIAGSIPRRYQAGGRWLDNRGISSLIEIGAVTTMGGYQQIRPSSGRLDYEFVTWEIPQGTHNFAAEATKSTGEAADITAFAKRTQALSNLSYRALLRNESFKRPGITTRKRIYLTGGVVRAMMILLHPEDQRNYAIISMDDINTFYHRAVTDPESLFNPDLSKIADENTRSELRKSRDEVKQAYNSKTLLAGAELLKAVAEELNLQDKTMIYPKFSYLSRILSYVRLQPE